MTTESLLPAESRELVPLGGALVQGSCFRYKIELVASKKYFGRPYYSFESNQVLIDEKQGILRFNARPAAIQGFIWNMVLIKDGKGNPVGLYTDIYVHAYRETKKFAMAHIEGHIVTCNNVWPDYVIEVQAKSEIKVEYYD